MKITVIGCGRWGSFIAWYLHNIHHDVTLYGRQHSEKFKQFKSTRTNGFVTLDEEIQLIDDLSSVVRTAEILVVSISAQSFRNLMKDLSQLDLEGKILVLV